MTGWKKQKQMYYINILDVHDRPVEFCNG